MRKPFPSWKKWEEVELVFRDGEDEDHYNLCWVWYGDKLYLTEKHVRFPKGCRPETYPDSKVHWLYARKPVEKEGQPGHHYVGHEDALELRAHLWITSRATALCLQYGADDLLKQTPEGWIEQHVGSKAIDGVWHCGFVRDPYAVKETKA